MKSWTLLLAAISLLLSPPLWADESSPIVGLEPDLEMSPTVDLEEPVAQPADPSAVAEAGEVAGEPSGEPADAPLGEDAGELAAESQEEAVDHADADADAPAEVEAGMGWDSFDDPSFDPVDGAAVAASASGPAAALGPLAVDAEGRRGRIHTVVAGDTLWDIAQTYLGTPWVWPSVWEDNDEIDNPHVIAPGDRVWVTAGEMRLVSEREADQMIAAESEMEVASLEPPPELLAEPELAPMEPVASLDEEELMADEVPASMDQLPVAVPPGAERSTDTGRSIRVATREAMGFISSKTLDAATSVVGSPSPRTWLAEGDMVYLGSGEGQVEVGDQFTVFRDAERVIDVENGSLLGYHVDVLGWVEVREVRGETAIAEVKVSRSEIERGDRVISRDPIMLDVPVKATPDGIDGRIVFMPKDRNNMADGDYVYLNRGSLHGFQTGSELEVYQSGRLAKETVNGVPVMTPSHVEAKLVLVDVRPDSSVAFVTHAARELEVGDLVRPAGPELASR